MYISTENYGDLHPVTLFFKNREMERLYKRYLASYHRKYLVWCFVILAVLNTLMFIVDIRNIPWSEGWGLFVLRGLAYPFLAVVSRMLLVGGFSCWYCRSVFAVVGLMAAIVLYRYDILYHMGHQGFDFGFQVSTMMLLYILCAGMIILPIMAQYMLLVITISALILHTVLHEPDGFVVHKMSWGIYTISTVVITTFAIWIRRHSRNQFYHLHLKPKAYARATEKNTVLGKMQNAFMANATAQILAHELKSPLATAYGYAQMNNDTHTQKSLEKMRTIIQNIDYLGKGKIKNVCLHVQAVLQRTSDLWLSACQHMQGTVHIENTLHTHDAGAIRADDVLLQGVIANIVRNGLQVRKKSIVTLTVGGDDTHIHMRISNDTARPTYLNDNVFMPMWGQDMWQQDMVFDTDPPPLQKSDSMGIGLAFAHDVMIRMKGKIYIDYNRNSTTDFVIEIPRC